MLPSKNSRIEELEAALERLQSENKDLKERYASLEAECYPLAVSNFTEQSQKKLLDASQDLIQQVKKTGEIVFVNETWHKTLGYSLEEVVGKSVFDFMNPERVAHCQSHLGKILTGETLKNFETEFIAKNGETVFLAGTAGPLFEEGEVVASFGFFKDVSKETATAAELSRKKALLYGITDAVPDLIFYKDLQGKYVGANHAFLEFVQIDLDDLIGKSDRDLFPEEVWDAYEATDRLVLETGKVIRNKEWVEHPSRGHILLDTVKTLYRDENDQPVGFIMVSRDITDIHQAQLEAEINQKRYKFLFDGNQLAICVNGSDRNIIEANEAFCKMFGYTKEELKKLGMVNISHPDDADISLRQGDQLRSGEIDHFVQEKRYFHRNGKVIYAITSVFGLPDKDGNVQETVTVITDITSRKEAEEARRESEEKFRILFDNVPLAIAFRDLETNRVTDVNRTGANLFSSGKKDHFVGKHRSEYILEQDQEKEDELIKKLLAGEISSYRMEKKYLSPDGPFDGELLRVLVSIKGKRFAVAIVTDISERKATEKKLKEQNAELTKINSELDKFVYSAAHDLRAPLMSVLGLIELIKLEEDPALKDHYLKLQERSLRKLDDFIQEIVNYSRNARQELRVESIQLKTLFEDIQSTFSHIPQAEKVKLSVSFEQASSFRTDQARLNIVLNNLISNAYRYHDPDKANPWIELTGKVTHEGAEIVIRDNGLGIPQVHLDKIFEMFYRANQQTTGSGLGLYIVQEAIQKLGGSVEVESEEGVGSTFTLKLPDLPQSVAVKA